MTNAEVIKLEEIVEAMSTEEKVVAVRCLPTEILEGELSRRSSRDREQNDRLRELVKHMERH